MGAKLSGSGGGKYAVEANSEINVTPFVDVMLVLLIIFMVAAPLASVNVKIALPPAVAKASTNPPKPIYISIQPSGKIYIGDFPSDLATLGDDMRKQLGDKRNPTKERIFIRADKDVMYGDFMGVMNMLQDNGFYSVALVGEDKK
ncbi:biopolymer transporter ExbD [Phenylobacterium aquaticum]|jgi:biopolymer transport protein ExbD|uniref:biopolymer transporter ExbD n=1 Tax=Phenylobacterium aquaticum TaxID=1763816 RepID=UPI001F5C9AA3|nr:biopolymer transporter ExbD [Phenylobacterium aquaticum]MCI3134157.1 biopolymer transporter ExbD [Phenylobacterium aquaticum]